MRHTIANLIMWIIQPVLGPMIRELDDNITQLIRRKVDHDELTLGEDGAIRPADPATFSHV